MGGVFFKDPPPTAHPPRLQRQALLTAVKEGDEVSVKNILAKGGDGGSAPLVGVAASHGHTHLLPCLVEAGYSIEDRSSGGLRPLMEAAYNGHAGTVKALLLLEANPQATNNEGLTALHLAAWGGHAECVSMLMANSPHEHKDKDGRTPLHLAAYKGCLEVVKELVKDGVTRFMEMDKKGCTPLDWAMEKGHTAVADLLLKMIGTELGGADYTQRVDELETAVRDIDEVKIRDILAREGDPKLTFDCTGGSVSSVALAAFSGHTYLLPGLVVAGLSVEGRGSDGETPLMKAAWNGHAETVKALLLLGANSAANSEDSGMSGTVDVAPSQHPCSSRRNYTC